MCTVSIKVNDDLLKKAGINMDSDVDISEWMQRQIEALLIEMALSAKRNAHTTPHFWDNYELSPEILAMAPKTRHNVFGDFKEEDIIITRDERGFKDFPIQHVSAEQFLDKFLQ